MRTEVHFHTVDGLRLHGWLYLPDAPADAVRPHPCVILSHGFSAIKTMGLAEYAESFIKRGLACLVYDHRNYGDSEGQPRHESDPWMQVRDMREAITFAANHEAIDAERIGLWGTSYSGGHVLVVAALDNRVQCVVSQVPLVSGSQNLRHWIPESAWNKMQARFSEDRAKRARGESPKMIISSREGDETWQWQQAVDHEGRYANETTQRSLELMDEYEPRHFIDRIAPRPLMMVIATEDTQTPSAGQLAAFELAGEPKRKIMVDGRHYDAYTQLFDDTAHAAGDWFEQYLGSPGATANAAESSS